jgi:hypothetical protein
MPVDGSVENELLVHECLPEGDIGGDGLDMHLQFLT